MSQDMQNDWLVPMFWCVCISMSDQSPSTKWCNKQDCRNQVLQFLTNPFLANFQNGHSPPLYLVGFADCDPRGNPMSPLVYGGHGLIHGQKCQIQEKWCVGCMSQDVQNDWLVPMFWCVCISMSDQSPSTKRCNKQETKPKDGGVLDWARLDCESIG